MKVVTPRNIFPHQRVARFINIRQRGIAGDVLLPNLGDVARVRLFPGAYDVTTAARPGFYYGLYKCIVCRRERKREREEGREGETHRGRLRDGIAVATHDDAIKQHICMYIYCII